MAGVVSCVSCFSDCGPLNSPLNGEVDMNQGTLFEAVATFECDVGYSMVGSATTTCLSTASWSDPEPVCNIKGRLCLRHGQNEAFSYYFNLDSKMARTWKMSKEQQKGLRLSVVLCCCFVLQNIFSHGNNHK